MGCEELERLADKYGTPLYLTDFAKIEENFRHMHDSLSGLKSRIFYSLKANSNPFIIKFLSGLGAGFDVLSTGELLLALKCGIKSDDIIFSATMIPRRHIRAGIKTWCKIEPRFNSIYSKSFESRA